MAKKVGTCVNIDCDNYKQEIEVEPGGEFECPLCHQPLREKNTKRTVKGSGGGKGKKLAFIIIAIVVLGGGGYGIYSAMSGGEEAGTDVNQERSVIIEASSDTAKIDSVKPEVEKVSTPEPEKMPVEQKVQNGRGTVDLGYGTYTGELKNGKPHGYGTITYRQSHKIVPSKDFVAQPGDTFEGEFRNGRISGLGYWKHDGNQTVVKP